jgi:hypothetical protein
MLSMADTLELSVVTEGVETAEQLRVLQRLGGGEVQGYLISKALPVADAVRVVKDALSFCSIASLPQAERDKKCVVPKRDFQKRNDGIRNFLSADNANQTVPPFPAAHPAASSDCGL